ncbi:MAG: SUMF1/EgtB/PvdO family nonheme iron enzyme [Candidatus Omnitrophica bacterium]|nr:SUMF1/EgtB/PvdO family nonheme iron enzyme [Candidatus Omnitrophota bacterium]
MYYKKNFIFTLSLFVFFLLIPSFALAGGLEIDSFGPYSIDTDNDTLTFKADISWNYAWRNDVSHDAVWIFMKYYDPDDTEWCHATMAATGTNPTGFVPTQGAEIVVPDDGLGFFIRRATNGTSNALVLDPVEFVWDYGTDGLLDSDVQDATTTFRLFGIEMVYIPSGGFYVGDGDSSFLNGNFEDATSGDPKFIDSEDLLTLGGGGTGSLGNNNAAGMDTADDFNDSTSKTLPETFPKGYNAFYLMKYEITNGQYRDFLNTLTYEQQVSRTENAPNSAAGTRAMDDSFGNVYRNRIEIETSGDDSPSTPAVYACDLDNDGSYDETTDGEWIALTFLYWDDLAAFLDWAALRPWTELEFEKACRGPLDAIEDEYAWGTTDYKSGTRYTLSNAGQANEGIATNYSTTTGNQVTSGSYDSGNAGPMRVGIFAGNTSNTGRETAGAGYYGNMELTGNLSEQVVTVGHATGRNFKGTHGDGELTDDTVTGYEGNATNLDWPGIDSTNARGVTGSTGSGSRGGGWFDNISLGPIVSKRIEAADVSTSYIFKKGGRGARTAPVFSNMGN